MFAEMLGEKFYGMYRIKLASYLNISIEVPEDGIEEILRSGLASTDVEKFFSLCKVAEMESRRIFPLFILKAMLAHRGRLTYEEGERLFRVVHIIVLAEVIFGSDEKAVRWLSKPKSRFLGKSPCALLSTAQDALRVEEMLIQAAEGFSY